MIVKKLHRTIVCFILKIIPFLNKKKDNKSLEIRIYLPNSIYENKIISLKITPGT